MESIIEDLTLLLGLAAFAVVIIAIFVKPRKRLPVNSQWPPEVVEDIKKKQAPVQPYNMISSSIVNNGGLRIEKYRAYALERKHKAEREELMKEYDKLYFGEDNK